MKSCIIEKYVWYMNNEIVLMNIGRGSVLKSNDAADT